MLNMLSLTALLAAVTSASVINGNEAARIPIPSGMAPAVAVPINQHQVGRDLIPRDDPDIQKRREASVDLNRSWKNEVLFSGDWGEDDNTASFEVTCIDCYTKGMIIASVTTQHMKPVIDLQFQGFKAHIHVDVKTSGTATYAVNLFTSQSPIGIGKDGLSIGILFYVDLVFSANAELDMEGGFTLEMADTSRIRTGATSGKIKQTKLDGVTTETLPVIVRTGTAEFKADLRLRVAIGVEAESHHLGIGLGAMIGIYANLVEFVAQLDNTPDCEVEAKEFFDVNIGAYAKINAKVQSKDAFTFVPTASTTIYNSPTLTQCLLEAGQASPSGLSAGSDGLTSSTATSFMTSPVYGSSADVTSATGGSAAVVTPSARITARAPEVEGHDGSGPMVTHLVTSCAAKGVINCPASYQQEIVVTRPSGAPARKLQAAGLKPASAKTGSGPILLTVVQDPIAQTFDASKVSATVPSRAIITAKNPDSPEEPTSLPTPGGSTTPNSSNMTPTTVNGSGGVPTISSSMLPTATQLPDEDGADDVVVDDIDDDDDDDEEDDDLNSDQTGHEIDEFDDLVSSDGDSEDDSDGSDYHSLDEDDLDSHQTGHDIDEFDDFVSSDGDSEDDSDDSDYHSLDEDDGFTDDDDDLSTVESENGDDDDDANNVARKRSETAEDSGKDGHRNSAQSMTKSGMSSFIAGVVVFAAAFAML